MVSIAAVVILSVLVVSSTGAPSGNERIANGTLAVADEFPFMASVELNDPDGLGNNEKRHICGGFIYNDRYIITAASCVDLKSASEIFVTVGAISFTNPDPNEQHIGVQSIKIHENYSKNESRFNNIAIIRLDRPLTFSLSIGPLYYNDVLEGDNAGIVMGWGATFDGGLNSVNLRKTDVTIFSPTGTECKEYSSDLYSRNYMICAGNVAAGPCQYDEGSPLVQKGVAVGIMSHNKGCKIGGGVDVPPSLYTRLSAYYSWLRANAGQQPAPTTTTVVPGK